MSEYTRTSIHNHFGGPLADCTIDKQVGMEVVHDMSFTFSQIDEAVECGFELLGQTNSNDFDAASYLLARIYGEERGVELLPGVEISLTNWIDPSKTIHVVVLFDPADNVFSLQEDVRAICLKNERFAFSVDQLSELLCGRRAIICVHGIKQDKRSVSENVEIAKELVSLNRFMPVSFEDNRSYHKLQLQEKLKDWLTDAQIEWLTDAADVSTADRTSFKDIKSPTMIWAGNNFDNLYYSVLIGERRIMREEDVIRPVSFISRIEIEDANGMEQSAFDCSHGLNAIIGQSGSGKTLLLDAIKRKLTGQPLTESASGVADYSSIYDLRKIHLFDSEGIEITSGTGFEVVEGANLYQKIIKAYGVEDGELLTYLGLQAEGAGVNKIVGDFEEKLNELLDNLRRESEILDGITSKIALASSATRFIEANKGVKVDAIDYNKDSTLNAKLTERQKDLEGITADINEAKGAFKTLRKIAKQNGLSQEIEDSLLKSQKAFMTELVRKRKYIKLDAKELEFHAAAQTLLFDAVQSYNTLVSARFSQVNEKRQTLLDELQSLAGLSLERVEVELRRRIPALDKRAISKAIKLKSDSTSARLEIEDVNVSLEDRDKVAEAFPGAIGRKPKVSKTKFNPPYDLSRQDQVEDLVRVFFSANYDEPLNLVLPMDSLVKYNVLLKNEDGDLVAIEEQSAGMLSKVYVSQFLDRAISGAGSNTIVLYDQPEANMEKAFLLEVLSEKFDQLRQTHQLFVATHEPLLVVNADSNAIILAANNKRVTQGNRIRYENRSFIGTRGKSEMLEGIANLIDGGSKAVRRRTDIYEGMG